MGLTELIAVAVIFALLLAAWVYLLSHRRSLPRMLAILARKPHQTRRAHTIRQVVFNLEILRVLAPGVTAMFVAALLGSYLVDVEGWPGAIGVGLTLVTGTSGVAAWGVRHTRLARRMGLSCPACGVVLVEERGLEFVRSGHCPECSTALFGATSQQSAARELAEGPRE